MAIFVTIPGIPGESLDKDHPAAIDVLNFSWGLTNSGLPAAKKASPPSFSDLTIAKEIDRSTPKLALACATGQKLSEVLLDETASFTDEGRVTYLTVHLWDAVVSEVSETSGGEEPPSDVISFVFPKVEVVYTLLDSKGKKKGTERFGWDLVKNVPF
ncbi:MAG: type VI secretion system tube protein Hcp [Acidimicrobiia bacterium]|nr:type VI secretion system tube protein Hcp [Acidimicrobiia bacterium]